MLSPKGLAVLKEVIRWSADSIATCNEHTSPLGQPKGEGSSPSGSQEIRLISPYLSVLSLGSFISNCTSAPT